jgi:hypothetical protein
MQTKELQGLNDVSVSHLREYILDLVQELATLASRRGDASSARALRACWIDIREGDGA